MSASKCLTSYDEGLYEQQDEDQPDCNLRGKFYTDSDGNYGFYCLRPTPYPVSTQQCHVIRASLTYIRRYLAMVQRASSWIY